MDKPNKGHAELMEILVDDGYTLGESFTDHNGIIRVLVGKRWMTLAEIESLADQHDQGHELP